MLCSHFTPIYLFKEGGKDVHTMTDIQFFISALLILALNWKQFKCPQTEDCISKLYSTVEYCSEIKRNGLLLRDKRNIVEKS